jgi:hypothetical protein
LRRPEPVRRSLAILPSISEALIVDKYSSSARVFDRHDDSSRPAVLGDCRWLAAFGSLHDGGAEHGVGRLKCEEITHYKPAVEIELMRRIKRALDPDNIMYPGKVVRFEP